MKTGYTREDFLNSEKSFKLDCVQDEYLKCIHVAKRVTLTVLILNLVCFYTEPVFAIPAAMYWTLFTVLWSLSERRKKELKNRYLLL